jgi:hypothetical protein
MRFSLGRTVRINSSAHELSLNRSDDSEEVVLRPRHCDVAIGDAHELALFGGSYATEQLAEEAAAIWGARLRFAFARLHIGADFGLRAPRGSFTTHGLRALEMATGERVLNDMHGTTIYECNPPPRFAAVSVDVTVGKQSDQLVALVRTDDARGVQPDEKLDHVFDLFSASFFQPSPDARFLMLSMALETMIVQERRCEELVTHLETLVQATREAEHLSRSEQDSLIGSLQRLSTESVGAAGRRLARSLGERRYLDGTESPADFFSRCYEMRSALVHGHYPRSDRGAVDRRAAALELFVGDLISTAWAAERGKGSGFAGDH